MLMYSIIMFSVGLLFAGMGIAIYKGRTDLIHDYHQTKVADRVGYGKAFGKAMLVVAAAPLLSGIVSLFGNSDTVAMIAVAVLSVGLIIGIVCMVVVQKKFNNGIY